MAKHGKIIIALCLALIMAFSLSIATYAENEEMTAPTAEAPTTGTPATEAPTETASATEPTNETQTHWSDDAVQEMAEEGIIPPESANPERPLIAADITEVSARIFKYTPEELEARLPRISADKWRQVQQYIEENGINLYGRSVDDYDPGATLTRERAFVIIAKIFMLKGEENAITRFVDYGEVSPETREYVNALINAGYIVGTPEGRLDPQGMITYGQFVQILQNIFGNGRKALPTLAELQEQAEPATEIQDMAVNRIDIQVQTEAINLSVMENSTSLTIDVGGFEGGGDSAELTVSGLPEGVTITGLDSGVYDEKSNIKTFDVSVSADVSSSIPKQTPLSVGIKGSDKTQAVDLNYFDGTTEENAIPITNANILTFNKFINQNLYNYKAYCYILTEDITLTDLWEPVGGFYAGRFKGIFDGNGKTISGLRIDDPSGTSTEHAGFFGCTDKGSVVKNLNFEDVVVNGICNNVGAIVGYCNGSVLNCNVSGIVEGKENTGGIIGFKEAISTYNEISNCSFKGSVKGTKNVGGISGCRGEISKCYVIADVYSSGDTAGGIVGKSDYSSISDCYALGSVKADGNGAGGICGILYTTVYNSFAANTVTAKNHAGGIIGSGGGTITSCIALNETIQSTDANSFAGYVSANANPVPFNPTMKNCYAFVFTKVTAGGVDIESYIINKQDEVTPAPSEEIKSIDLWQNMGFVFGVDSWLWEEGYLPHLAETDLTEWLEHLKQLSGEGTIDNPHIISDAITLRKVGTGGAWGLSSHYRLGADITLSGGFTPIGTHDNPFSGSFDGAGHSITGLTISTDNNNAGLFGVLSGTVYDLHLKNAVISGGSSTAAISTDALALLISTDALSGMISTEALSGVSSTGAFAGVNKGRIEKCSLTGQSKVNGVDFTGGLVGTNSGTILNCMSDCAVNGARAYAGGIVGRTTGGSINRCYSLGSVTADGLGAGGIAGCYSRDPSISTSPDDKVIVNCFALNGIVGVSSTFPRTPTGLANITGLARITYMVPDDTTSDVNYGYDNMILRLPSSGKKEADQSNISDGRDISMSGMKNKRIWDSLGFAFDRGIWRWDSDGTYMPYLSENAKVCWPDTTDGEGSGTKEDPYKVYDMATLSKVGSGYQQTGNWGLEDHYILTKDIYCTNAMDPLTGPATPFSGTFNGNGHSIHNLSITYDANNYKEKLYRYNALFSETAPKARIENLTLVNPKIAGHCNLGYGIIAGQNEGVIYNCHIKNGIVTGGATYTGGIAAYNKNTGNIDNCTITAKISGGGYVGGIVGLSELQGISDCTFNGSITGTGDNIGGITGAQWDGGIYRCKTYGTIRGNKNVGGIVGNSTSFNKSVSECVSQMSVSGVYNIGGIAGTSYAKIVKSFAAGKVASEGSNPENTGGLVGVLVGAVESCYASGDVTGGQNVGGLIGQCGTSENGMSLSEWLKDTEIGNKVGEKFGPGYVPKEMKKYAPWLIDDLPESSAAEFTSIYNARVWRSYATGFVTGKDDVGALVGSNKYKTEIIECYSTGNVEAAGDCGGIAGFNDSIIKKCVALGAKINSTASCEIGRIVGFTPTIYNSGLAFVTPYTELANNYAKDDMKLYEKARETKASSSSEGNHGITVTRAETQKENWWFSYDRGYSHTHWMWDAGFMRPVLKYVPQS